MGLGVLCAGCIHISTSWPPAFCSWRQKSLPAQWGFLTRHRIQRRSVVVARLHTKVLPRKWHTCFRGCQKVQTSHKDCHHLFCIWTCSNANSYVQHEGCEGIGSEKRGRPADRHTTRQKHASLRAEMRVSMLSFSVWSMRRALMQVKNSTTAHVSIPCMQTLCQ